MGLFSLFRKNKQESASDDSDFYSRAEEESKAVRGRIRRKQAGDPVDPVLPEKKRARRRLVGALALVLAAVIGLPMILDSGPKPMADDIAIQIPSRDKQIPNAIKAPVSGAAAASRVAVSASLDRKEEVVVETSTTDAQPVVIQVPNAAVAGGAAIGAGAMIGAAGDSQAKQESRVPYTGKPANTKAAVKTERPAEPKAEHVGKSDNEQLAGIDERATDAARAKAILEGKMTAVPDTGKIKSDRKADRFAVQVAALASKEKIDELRGKLNKAGIQPYTQKVATASGERTRIRVGPFASREEADKMRARLGKLGLNGTIVPSSQ